MEEDKKLLEEIEVFEAARDAKTLEERNEKNQRLFWMQDVLKMQKIEEAKRHKEIETLFSEEAEKMWKKQEAVWRRENEARKHLMEDVLAGLKEQIRVQIQDKDRQKTMVEQERCKIEEAIQTLSRDIEKEEEAKKRQKEVYVQDLDDQIEEKKKLDQIQRFKETNELASRLSKFEMAMKEPVITVSV